MTVRLACCAFVVLAACDCGASAEGGLPVVGDAGHDAARPLDPGEPTSEATGRTAEGEDSDGHPDTPPASSLGAAGDRLDVGESDAVFVAPDYAVSGDTVLLVGDMNGDGRSEIAVGDRHYQLAGDREHRGAVYLLYGRSDFGDEPTLGPPDATLANGFAVGGFVEIAAAGDVNGDGLADLLVGFSNGTFCDGDGPAGHVYLLYGRRERLSGTVRMDDAAVELRGDHPCDFTGLAFDGAGDLDGDGFDDFALTEADGDAFRVHVFYGRTAHLPSGDLTAASARIVAADSTLFGAGIAGLGDVDDDGYGDLLVGDQAVHPEVGSVRLIYGGKDRLRGTVEVTDLPGATLREAGGNLLCPVGDTDGDGLADLAFVREDRAVSFYQSPGGRLADGAEPTAILATERRQGTACGSAGDLDADGDAELWVSDPGYDHHRGVVYIVPGGTRLDGPTELADVSIAWIGRAYVDGDSVLSDSLGSASGGEDVNGDGIDDLVMGASDDHVGDVTGGRVYLVLGRP